MIFTSLSSRYAVAAVTAFLSLLPVTGLLATGQVVLNDPAFPSFHSGALDQPRLYGLLTDNGAVIEDEQGPVIFRAFVDTGSSGFVLSNLHATGDHDVQSFGFVEEDYIGQYTNLGIGGEETGRVSRDFGVRLINDPMPTGEEIPLTEFIDYGEHRLWVREAPGLGEVTMMETDEWVIPLVSPVNIVGMPVIEQRVMVMEWQPIPEELSDMLPPEARSLETKLLEKGDSAIPAGNVTLDLEMRHFVTEAREGEVLPGVARNPLVKNVRITHDRSRGSITSNWLFDTGAGSSFISFRWAKEIGLIPGGYENLAAYLADHTAAGGMTSQVGGIGPGTVDVPILNLNEIRVPAREGFDVVWENVRVLVFEHPDLADLELEGIFGMNLIGPAATVDSSLLEELGFSEDGGGNQQVLDLLFMLLSDITPSPFTSVVFEVTGEETGELRLSTMRADPFVAGSYDSWRDHHFTSSELADEEVSGEMADPDGDGVPNLLEYAFGGVPGSFTRRHRFPHIREEGGHLAMTFDRFRQAAGIAYVVEASSDLDEWVEIWNSGDVPYPEDGFNVAVTTVSDPEAIAGSGKRFLRMRIDRVAE